MFLWIKNLKNLIFWVISTWENMEFVNVLFLNLNKDKSRLFIDDSANH